MGENPAALRAAVFSLSSKNLRGGGVQTPPPPPAGRGLITGTRIFQCWSLIILLVSFVGRFKIGVAKTWGSFCFTVVTKKSSRIRIASTDFPVRHLQRDNTSVSLSYALFKTSSRFRDTNFVWYTCTPHGVSLEISSCHFQSEGDERKVRNY